MIWKIISAIMMVIAGGQTIDALQPGENVTLPPGRFNEGQKHFTFWITVTRDQAPTPPPISLPTASTTPASSSPSPVARNG